MTQIQCGDKTFDVTETIATGMTATVYRTTCGHVLKQFHKSPSRGHIDREYFWLTKLADENIAPKPVAYDESRRVILMTDCGNPVMGDTLPSDWREQMERILSVFKEHNCSHNDLSEREVLVLEEKLYVIDFGFASLGEDMSCGGKFADDVKGRLFDDTHIISLLEFLLLPQKQGTELHTFVLWEKGEQAAVEEKIQEKFRVIQAITYNPKTLKMLGRDRVEVLTKFYHGRMSHHGEKGMKPFVVYVVLDENPVYEERTNAFNGTTQMVNINTFDNLQELRAGRTSFIHGSDNTQESYENLKTLSLYTENIPVCYWEHWRPKFTSFEHFFETLNTTNLSYVVLRNFDTLPEDTDYGKKNDIDMLVEDYYLFKRITGALSYKHKRPKAHKRGGPAVEYGGYKVAGKVSIAGREVSVDVRFVGDNYYPRGWEEEVLKSRRAYKGFFVPDEEHFFYTLLYHTLVHKRNMSDVYRKQLSQMAKERNLCEGTLSGTEAWTILDAFMEEKGYTYVRPDELTLPFTARDRAGISISEDIQKARQFRASGRFVEASHLLRQILSDEPQNVEARMLLCAVRTRLFIEEEHRLPLKRFLYRIKELLRL
ncbi:hypothetical protein KTR10_00125 [Candidatus Kaiserbacteria bacterium]|nr:hypothetical protein [Candidatus Kaiserbacteria bacterium]